MSADDRLVKMVCMALFCAGFALPALAASPVVLASPSKADAAVQSNKNGDTAKDATSAAADSEIITEDVEPNNDRIRALAYNPNDIYSVVTRVGFASYIEFGTNEEIDTISVGERSFWQLIPSGHRLFIRPLKNEISTNMTVITNKHSYQFDLRSTTTRNRKSSTWRASPIRRRKINRTRTSCARRESAIRSNRFTCQHSPALRRSRPWSAPRQRRPLRPCTPPLRNRSFWRKKRRRRSASPIFRRLRPAITITR